MTSQLGGDRKDRVENAGPLLVKKILPVGRYNQDPGGAALGMGTMADTAKRQKGAMRMRRHSFRSTLKGTSGMRDIGGKA